MVKPAHHVVWRMSGVVSFGYIVEVYNLRTLVSV